LFEINFHFLKQEAKIIFFDTQQSNDPVLYFINFQNTGVTIRINQKVLTLRSVYKKVKYGTSVAGDGNAVVFMFTVHQGIEKR
jgi:hypothetical protein